MAKHGLAEQQTVIVYNALLLGLNSFWIKFQFARLAAQSLTELVCAEALRRPMVVWKGI